jgi:hypothetical protein
MDGDEIFWGLFLIVAGTALLLSRLGIANFHWMFRNLWPLFLVTIGLSKLFHRKSIWAGLWMITLGAWFQAVTLHFHGLTYESSWPMILVLFGAGIILKTIVGSVRRGNAEEQENHHV